MMNTQEDQTKNRDLWQFDFQQKASSSHLIDVHHLSQLSFFFKPTEARDLSYFLSGMSGTFFTILEYPSCSMKFLVYHRR